MLLSRRVSIMYFTLYASFHFAKNIFYFVFPLSLSLNPLFPPLINIFFSTLRRDCHQNDYECYTCSWAMKFYWDVHVIPLFETLAHQLIFVEIIFILLSSSSSWLEYQLFEFMRLELDLKLRLLTYISLWPHSVPFVKLFCSY